MRGRGPTAHWKGEHAMRFIEETGFCVRVGREEAFQKWLVANEERIAAAYPAGTSYIGTFVTAFTSEKTAGGYRVLEGLDSYAALDVAAAPVLVRHPRLLARHLGRPACIARHLGRLARCLGRLASHGLRAVCAPSTVSDVEGGFRA